MAFKILFITNTPNKLEHMALWQICSKLINTCLIFTYNSLEKCCCDQFQGCWLKSLVLWLDGKRIYCFVCRVNVAYNMTTRQEDNKNYTNYKHVSRNKRRPSVMYQFWLRELLVILF